ncbi:MAG: hypothetical protein H7267_12985 [Sandarakinorhabdus sp.]|nr:hypothetical protein [Sandarakinorhabdus sp.]
MTKEATFSTSEQRDKLGVFILCGFALGIIGGISWGAIQQRIPSDSQTLLGVIVGGIMIFARECLTVIRQFWTDAKTAKLTDQLAASTIVQDTPPIDPPPADVAAAADEMVDAAKDKAADIKGDGR